MARSKKQVTKRQVERGLAVEDLRMARARRRLVDFELVERVVLLLATIGTAALAITGDYQAAGGSAVPGVAVVLARFTERRRDGRNA